MDGQLERAHKALDYAKEYFHDLNALEPHRKKSFINHMLPTVMDGMANAVTNLADTQDLTLKGDFILVAAALLEQEKAYDPNPGKTRYNADIIKRTLPQLK